MDELLARLDAEITRSRMRTEVLTSRRAHLVDTLAELEALLSGRPAETEPPPPVENIAHVETAHVVLSPQPASAEAERRRARRRERDRARAQKQRAKLKVEATAPAEAELSAAQRRARRREYDRARAQARRDKLRGEADTPPAERTRHDPSVRREASRLFAQGATVAEVSQQLNVKQSTACNWRYGRRASLPEEADAEADDAPLAPPPAPKVPEELLKRHPALRRLAPHERADALFVSRAPIDPERLALVEPSFADAVRELTQSDAGNP